MPAVRPRHRVLAVLAVITLAVLPSCGRQEDSATEGGRRTLQVVTTVAPITSIVASVAGDRARVTGLVPEGTDSHTFEPPPSAARALSRADLVFVNGLKLEDPVRRLAAANLRSGAELVELGERTLPPSGYIYDFSFPKEAGRPNPHLWTSPPMAESYARVVADTLARRDAAGAEVYERNYERFAAKADELDEAMKRATATVPAPKLLTYHDAYAYFARHYGWTVIGAVQVSSFDDPAPREVADLVEQVRREKVPAIFGSEVFPSPVLEQIGREAGVRYVDVLRDDDLPGEPGDPEHSWLGLVRSNFVTMVESLGGDASELRAVKADGTAPDRAKYAK